MRKLEIIGDKFGMLQVISEHSKTRNGHIRYTCLCECGNTCNILLTHLKQGNTTHCGCKTPSNRGKNHVKWRGFGEISGNFWYNVVLRERKTTNRKKLEVTITIEEAWDMFQKQNRKCALSGIILSFPNVYNDKSCNASLDRIDSSKGYTKENCQWVHKDINIMKNKFNQDYFIKICKLISDACEIRRI